MQPSINTFLVGYYNGSIRFCDGEASGVEVFAVEELKSDMNKNPEKYTEDLRYMVSHYEKYLVPVKEIEAPAS